MRGCIERWELDSRIVPMAATTRTQRSVSGEFNAGAVRFERLATEINLPVFFARVISSASPSSFEQW